jgi:enoyl-CoA hydratase
LEDSPAIVSEVTDGIGVIRLNRPNQRNALSIENLRELDATLSSLLHHSDLKSVIVTGTDNVFAAGADLRELVNLDSSSALEFAKLGQRVFQRIADARQTTIAAINGYCMGGGLDLALACDIRIASPQAVFSHPGTRRGIITGWGGTQRLPRIIGRTRAIELFATARRLSSEEALFLGLVTRVGDPVLECAFNVARQALQGSKPRTEV